jgi:hypothetical protein
VLELGSPLAAAAVLAWLDAAGGPAHDDINDMPELVDTDDGVRPALDTAWESVF